MLTCNFTNMSVVLNWHTKNFIHLLKMTLCGPPAVPSWPTRRLQPTQGLVTSYGEENKAIKLVFYCLNELIRILIIDWVLILTCLLFLSGPSGVGVNELRRHLIEMNPNIFQGAVPRTSQVSSTPPTSWQTNKTCSDLRSVYVAASQRETGFSFFVLIRQHESSQRIWGVWQGVQLHQPGDLRQHDVQQQVDRNVSITVNRVQDIRDIFITFRQTKTFLL